MEITDEELRAAEARTDELRARGHAVAARYDRDAGRVVVSLHNGVELSFPAAISQPLANASPEDLEEVEVEPDGLALFWPRLDDGLTVPGLLAGSFGTRAWMASLMGQAGGKVSTPAKAAAARENGRKGGRPRHAAGD